MIALLREEGVFPDYVLWTSLGEFIAKALKGFSYRPMLIHVNGVTEDVLDSDFFFRNYRYGTVFARIELVCGNQQSIHFNE